MNSPIKQYDVTLEVIGPVHVGSGAILSKKSYVFSDKRHMEMIDLEKMYTFLKKKGLAEKYEQYLMYISHRRNDRNDIKFQDWLERNRIKISDIQDCVKYTIDCGDAIQIDSNDMQISEHIKDAYGMPYIPGSSLKGMLRTILLSSDIINNSDKYSEAGRDMSYNIGKTASRKRYLSGDIKTIETTAFNELNKSKKKSDAVNDYMSGIIVSDSEPICIDDMVLCGQLEGHVNGDEHKINTMRECIKPGTLIKFTITIDETLCKLNPTDVYNAVNDFADCYNKCFISSFKNAEKLQNDYVILGGGSGYVSKTIMYPLYGEKAGVRNVHEVLMRTVAKERNGNHKNQKDLSEGIAPHIIKYTRCNGHTLQMGVCKLTIS